MFQAKNARLCKKKKHGVYNCATIDGKGSKGGKTTLIFLIGGIIGNIAVAKDIQYWPCTRPKALGPVIKI